MELIDYAKDPRFELIYEGKEKIYFLKDNYITELHKSREIEAHVQNIRSSTGATPDYLRGVAKAGVDAIENDPKSEKLRQTCLAIFNEIIYRVDNPIDSINAIRMGAIFSFIDGEPFDANGAWIDKKIQLALEDPELKSFFTNWGISNTPSYSTHLNSLIDPDYFHKRQEMTTSLKPSEEK